MPDSTRPEPLVKRLPSPAGFDSDGSGAGVLVSDEERERVAERVRAAVADGRLELAELDERLGRVCGRGRHQDAGKGQLRSHSRTGKPL
ncbi:DUF1707 SHOCT-like domain-containing protein [Streptomyces sp. 1222.5]|uniref:DUF1707 SHOCT-like domain-containing protein n=1 Tax=Streptomyces sp. 1222.5 TaxID=1881026 RepID=UPI003EBF808C